MLFCVSNYELIHYWSIMTICPYIYILYYKCRRLQNVQIPMTIFTSLLINHLRLASMLALYLLNATTELSQMRWQTNPAVTKRCSAIYHHFVTEVTITYLKVIFRVELQQWDEQVGENCEIQFLISCAAYAPGRCGTGNTKYKSRQRNGCEGWQFR